MLNRFIIIRKVIENEGIRREFAPGETKNIKYGELEKLSYTPGGTALMTHFLQIKTEKVNQEDKLIIYALGETPTADITIQITIKEVII